MIKLIYALWTSKEQSNQKTRDLLLNDVQPGLYDAGVNKLTMYIDDEYSTVRSPAPKLYRGPAISAEISLWTDDLEQQKDIEKIWWMNAYTPNTVATDISTSGTGQMARGLR